MCKKLTLLILTALILSLYSCSIQSLEITESPKPTVTPIATPETTPYISPETTSEPIETTIPEAEANYVMREINNNLVLMPESGDDFYKLFEENINSVFWTISESKNNSQIRPAALKVEKIDSITGKIRYQPEDVIVDVYKITLGDLCFYDYSMKPIEEEKLIQEFANRIYRGQYGNIQLTRDYAVMRLFDDLYAIDKDDNVFMISSRNINGYNYETIELFDYGDVYPWTWVGDFSCNLSNNRVFYLTSREGKFFNVWYIDIDKNEESRFSDDVAFVLVGSNADSITLYLRSDYHDFFGIIRNTYDSEIYEIHNEKNIRYEAGYIIYEMDDFTILKKGNTEIKLYSKYKDFFPFALNDNQLWTASKYNNNQIRSFINFTGYGIIILENLEPVPISRWFEIFRHKDDNRINYEELNGIGIEITMPTSMGVKTWK